MKYHIGWASLQTQDKKMIMRIDTTVGNLNKALEIMTLRKELADLIPDDGTLRAQLAKNVFMRDVSDEGVENDYMTFYDALVAIKENDYEPLIRDRRLWPIYDYVFPF